MKNTIGKKFKKTSEKKQKTKSNWKKQMKKQLKILTIPISLETKCFRSFELPSFSSSSIKNRILVNPSKLLI